MILSRHETAELLLRAQAGSSRAEDELCRANLPLARSVAGRWVRYARGRLEYDDLLSAALLGLLSAVRGYDPGSGCQFSTYACTAMNRQCQRALVNADVVRVPAYAQAAGVEAPQVLSLDYASLGEDGGTLADTLEAEDDVEGAAVANLWTEGVLARLHTRERVVIDLHVLGDEPLAVAGATIGLSREGARHVFKRAVARLAESVAA